LGSSLKEAVSEDAIRKIILITAKYPDDR